MQTHVNFHAARSGEALQTALTLKGLDTRVRFHVCGEGALDSKSSEALFALERLLVRVDANVADKIAGLLELLGAVWAAVPANAILLSDRAWKGGQSEAAVHCFCRSVAWCCNWKLLLSLNHLFHKFQKLKQELFLFIFNSSQ